VEQGLRALTNGFMLSGIWGVCAVADDLEDVFRRIDIIREHEVFLRPPSPRRGRGSQCRTGYCGRNGPEESQSDLELSFVHLVYEPIVNHLEPGMVASRRVRSCCRMWQVATRPSAGRLTERSHPARNIMGFRIGPNFSTDALDKDMCVHYCVEGREAKGGEHERFVRLYGVWGSYS
jgi:hypothetical protein